MTNTTHSAFTSFLNRTACRLFFTRLFIHWSQQQHETNEHHNVFNPTTDNNNNDEQRKSSGIQQHKRREWCGRADVLFLEFSE
jgi:hypothetical protein